MKVQFLRLKKNQAYDFPLSYLINPFFEQDSSICFKTEETLVQINVEKRKKCLICRIKSLKALFKKNARKDEDQGTIIYLLIKLNIFYKYI